MYAHARFKSILLLFGLMFCFGASDLFAGPAAEEWVDIEVVVNVVDGANGTTS